MNGTSFQIHCPKNKSIFFQRMNVIVIVRWSIRWNQTDPDGHFSPIRLIDIRVQANRSIRVLNFGILVPLQDFLPSPTFVPFFSSSLQVNIQFVLVTANHVGRHAIFRDTVFLINIRLWNFADRRPIRGHCWLDSVAMISQIGENINFWRFLEFLSKFSTNTGSPI